MLRLQAAHERAAHPRQQITWHLQHAADLVPSGDDCLGTFSSRCPKSRASAAEALRLPWFTQPPLPAAAPVVPATPPAGPRAPLLRAAQRSALQRGRRDRTAAAGADLEGCDRAVDSQGSKSTVAAVPPGQLEHGDASCRAAQRSALQRGWRDRTAEAGAELDLEEGSDRAVDSQGSKSTVAAVPPGQLEHGDASCRAAQRSALQRGWRDRTAAAGAELDLEEGCDRAVDSQGSKATFMAVPPGQLEHGDAPSQRSSSANLAGQWPELAGSERPSFGERPSFAERATDPIFDASAFFIKKVMRPRRTQLERHVSSEDLAQAGIRSDLTQSRLPNGLPPGGCRRPHGLHLQKHIRTPRSVSDGQAPRTARSRWPANSPAATSAWASLEDEFEKLSS
ncbi:unnamed protein product [Prorocentrum cordatum]|uniref:Uncharacterized protein n=1 Tax=Prorocentrum cordatum TaxID=2364126 RepID=A0ABN9VJ80_9DINO|nr:unnamed protein product [Polarella glacialis]